LGPRFMAWWIDPSFERPGGQVLRILMVSYVIFLPVRGVALPILMGVGKPQWPTIGLLVAGIVNLGLSIALARPLGIAGVALGTAIPNAIFAIVVAVHACRELAAPVADFLHYVAPRAFIGAAPAFGVLLWFRYGLDVHTLPGLVGAGVTMVVAFAATWVFFVYRDDPYVNLRALLPTLRTR
jgi:O-antigen/teichoic acid export membrane protein